MKKHFTMNDELQKADRVAYLIAGHIKCTLSEEENYELENWIIESDENLEQFDKLIDEDYIEQNLYKYSRHTVKKGKLQKWIPVLLIVILFLSVLVISLLLRLYA